MSTSERLKKWATSFWSKKEKQDPSQVIQPSGLTKAEEDALRSNTEMNDNYLFDFRNYQADNSGWIAVGSGTQWTTGGVWTNSASITVSGDTESTDEPASDVVLEQDMEAPMAVNEAGTVRVRQNRLRRTTHTELPVKQAPVGKIKAKPVDVVMELEHEPNLVDLNNLDDKIAILKDKEKLIRQVYAKREVTALIERLELRKKYGNFKDFFSQYKNTNDAKIEALLSKYQLVMKTSDIFIPEFPDEAIMAMKAYTEVMNKLCGKKPIFYVIAEEDKFRKAFEKRDPILLVQSPFGFFWQILGAWDKEMLILSEL
jgi:hypothetical protein